MKKYKDLPRIPIETTIEITGCRWKILIIKELLDGTKRFNELKKGVTGISQKVLTSKLRELQDDEILIRKVAQQSKQKVEYTLTDVGYSLRTVINSMSEWGKDYKKYVKLYERLNS